MGAETFKKFAISVVVTGMAALVSLPSASQMTTGNSIGFGSAIHGVPPSVTSFGFGGHPGFHGVPASVTSLGFGSSGFRIHQGPFFHQRPFFSHHRRHSGFVSPFFGDIVAVPYAYPVYVMEPGVDDSMEEEDYRGGPTIFDRRGSGRDDYRRPVEDYRKPRSREDDRVSDDNTSVNQQRKEQPVTPQPQTVLVFKDGRQLEIRNYAIVGPTLYDLGDGKTRKVALAELDLSATVKQNDERGVDFQVPATSKLN